MRTRIFSASASFEGLPTVLILGRTNAGKSTLFNRLVGKRKNIVLDEPGVTRDFLEEAVEWEEKRFRLIDTAGFEPTKRPNRELCPSWSYPEVQLGIRHVLDEADLVLYLIDGKEDTNPVDREVLRDLAKKKKPTLAVINKIDSHKRELAAHTFHELGISPLTFISSEHNLGISELLDAIIERLQIEGQAHGPAPTQTENNAIKVAIVGRPNVGKSTLANALYGKERAIVSARPGTTRDAILIDVIRSDKRYQFVDTAGIRRPGRREGDVERISVTQSLEGIKEADVVLWVIDADASIAEQDKKVLGEILEAKKPFAALFNKWDQVIAKGRTVRGSELEKKATKQFLAECPFAPYALLLFVSALAGSGKDAIWKAVDDLYRESHARFATSDVTARLEPIVRGNPPPPAGARPTRIYYASQVGIAPPRFAFFTNHPKQVGHAYRRFLEGTVRREFGLHHIPVQIIVRGKKSKDA